MNRISKEDIQRLEDTRNAVNVAVSDWNSILDEIQSEAQSFYDDKSDRWRESDKGQAYQQWIDEFDGVRWDNDMPDMPPEEPEAV